jgi:hypothetical protein
MAIPQKNLRLSHCDAPAGIRTWHFNHMVVAVIVPLLRFAPSSCEYDISTTTLRNRKKGIGLAGGNQDQYARPSAVRIYMEFYEAGIR